MPRLLFVLIVDVVWQDRLVNVVWQTRGDIIDVWSGIVLEIIDGVDAAARAFFDRAARLVILLRAFLVAQASRRRRRTEVRAAIATAWRSGRAAGAARCETAATAAGPRSAEPTATAAKSATGPRTSETSARSAWPRPEAS